MTVTHKDRQRTQEIDRATDANSSERSVAIWVGVLYILATVAPASALGVWGSLTDGPGILTNAASMENQLIVVTLAYLVMAIAVAGVAFMIYPILRRVSETTVQRGLAAWYVGTRVTEGAIFLVGILATFAFLPLSKEFITLPASETGAFEANAAVLQMSADLAFALGQTVFALGAGMLYYLMLRSRIVPRWLSVWGLIAAPLFVVASLSLLWTADPNSTVSTILYIPMAIQEMVLAVWLIVKGFNLSKRPSPASD